MIQIVTLTHNTTQSPKLINIILEDHHTRKNRAGTALSGASTVLG
ncbi:MAG: hypothetical protein ACRCZT_06655 [Plesiomonas sp.]